MSRRELGLKQRPYLASAPQRLSNWWLLAAARSSRLYRCRRCWRLRLKLAESRQSGLGMVIVDSAVKYSRLRSVRPSHLRHQDFLQTEPAALLVRRF